ncbi:3-phosphoshikimate 1-carboxyvinyltransferase [Bacillus sp. SM2101]|uniref:3-phosphoshikimate 1-carboxyvinyltransferase n=1 Tax=Bacillus sp. SM2101 TaxID=2805366 RepID=UPI001BDE8493|nr:3-phosphoshikimate 1-carboxyvinyltransferase [Bacillus sp. SM2101]
MKNSLLDMKARSPWSSLKDKNVIKISPKIGNVNGIVTIPGSKSFTNRALILSALATGKSVISGVLKSDDSYWCLETLRNLGVGISINDDIVSIEGLNGMWSERGEPLYIGAAGTIARFLPGVLAIANKGSWEIHASKRMSERPIKPLIDALLQTKASIKYLGQEGYYPLMVKGSGFKGGNIPISGALSSQFISGLLLAAPYAKETVNIAILDHIVQKSYVNITLDLMEKFGAEIQYDKNLSHIKIEPKRYVAQHIHIEPDISTASYFLALAAITNGRIRIPNINYQTKQPDIQLTDILARMGCKVTKGANFIEVQGPPRLKGGFEISMKEMSDQALTVAVIAPFADGPITIKEVAHIRHHESDRINAICTSLSKLNIKVTEFEDGLTVYPGEPTPTLLQSYDDHRVAMALSLIGSRVEGIMIENPGCVSKTCPTYFDLLKELGLGVS